MRNRSQETKQIEKKKKTIIDGKEVKLTLERKYNKNI